MLNIKYLYEIQFLANGSIPSRAYVISDSQDKVDQYALKNNLNVLHIKELAATIGDPHAKGNEIGLLMDLS